MEADIREFVVDALRHMNYDVSGVTGDTDLGPSGLALESLAVAELAVLAEDRFGVIFTDDEAEGLVHLTVDQLVADLARRVAVPASGVAEWSRPGQPGELELPDHDDVIGMLASFGQRSAQEVPDEIGSLELTWLITKAELRYGVTLELSDETLAQMSTVSGAVTALRDALPGAEHG